MAHSFNAFKVTSVQICWGCQKPPFPQPPGPYRVNYTNQEKMKGLSPLFSLVQTCQGQKNRKKNNNSYFYVCEEIFLVGLRLPYTRKRNRNV